jgi:hypothetical protein
MKNQLKNSTEESKMKKTWKEPELSSLSVDSGRTPGRFEAGSYFPIS